MAKFKRNPELKPGQHVVAKLWYYSTAAIMNQTSGKAHVCVVTGTARNPRLAVQCRASGWFPTGSSFRIVDSLPQSELCIACRDKFKHELGDIVSFSMETLKTDDSGPFPDDLKEGVVVPVVVGHPTESGKVRWNNKVHAGIYYRNSSLNYGVRLHCSDIYYRRIDAKVVTKASRTDICQRCIGTDNPYGQKLLEKLGLDHLTGKQDTPPKEINTAPPMPEGLKRIVPVADPKAFDGVPPEKVEKWGPDAHPAASCIIGRQNVPSAMGRLLDEVPNHKSYHLVVAREDVHTPDIVSFTRQGLKDFLMNNLELAERLAKGDGVYLFIGKWAKPVITFKKTIDKFDIDKERT